MPFERLVKALNPPRSVSRHPLFQVMLAFQVTLASEDDTGISTWRLPGLRTRLEPLGPEPAKFDLHLTVHQRRAADGRRRASAAPSNTPWTCSTQQPSRPSPTG